MLHHVALVRTDVSGEHSLTFLAHRFLSPWWLWRYVSPKCWFLQGSHSVTSQTTAFFSNFTILSFQFVILQNVSMLQWSVINEFEPEREELRVLPWYFQWNCGSTKTSFITANAGLWAEIWTQDVLKVNLNWYALLQNVLFQKLWKSKWPLVYEGRQTLKRYVNSTNKGKQWPGFFWTPSEDTTLTLYSTSQESDLSNQDPSQCCSKPSSSR
jgi:hypothetical protein